MDDQIQPSADSVERTTEAEETQVSEPTETVDNQQPETNDQGDQDSFFDPNSVPEELKPAYKQMQAAFTKKTQEIAEAKKEAEAIRQKAEAYDKYQKHISIVEEMQNRQPQAPVNPELEALKQSYREAGYNEDAIDMMTKGLEFVLGHFNQTQAVEKQQAWVGEQLNEVVKLDPRLNDQSLVYDLGGDGKATFGEIVEELVAADKNWMKDPKAATMRAIKKVDALIGKAKTDGKQELSTLAKSKARQFPSTSASPQGSSDVQEGGSMKDIAKQVAKDMGIKLS